MSASTNRRGFFSFFSLSFLSWLLAPGSWLLSPPSPAAAAAPTQEDVFKSIQENVGNGSGGGDRVLPFLLAGAGLVILLAVVSNRRKREVQPRAMNDHGKLLREVMKAVPLRRADLRQLKALAEDPGGPSPVSPLTLAMCPSLLAKSIRSRHARRAERDPKAATHLAQELGVTREVLEVKNQRA